MSGVVQKALNFGYHARGFSEHALIWTLLRIFGLEVRWSEIRQGRYESAVDGPESLAFSLVVDATTILDEARARWDEAESRRQAIMEKCRVLLGAGALIAALVGTLGAKVLTAEADWVLGLAFVGVLLLVLVVFLVSAALGVGRDMSVSVESEELAQARAQLCSGLATSYMQAAAYNDLRTNYLVDLFRVARSWFLVALAAIAVCSGVSATSDSEAERASRLASEVRGDRDLATFLRGPQGARGPRGQQGPVGPAGAQGPVGETGPSVVTDALLDSPEFRALVAAEVARVVDQRSDARKPPTVAE